MKRFRSRRWWLLLPYGFLFVCCDSLAEAIWLSPGLTIVALPYFLAWWLSDGFAFGEISYSTDEVSAPLYIWHRIFDTYQARMRLWWYMHINNARHSYHFSHRHHWHK